MKVLNVIVLLLISVALYAQEGAYNRKKILKEVKAYIKAGNYSNVDNTLKSAFDKYPEANSDAELYNIRMNANYNLALSENRKIYLSTNPDTVKYMEYIYMTYKYGLVCDSLDGVPDKKGRVKYKYRDNVVSKFMFFIKNLENAGKFFYKKRDYKKAYSYIDLYVTTSRFLDKASNSKNKKAKFQHVDDEKMAVLAVLSSYATGDYAATIKYLPVALEDSATRAEMIEIGCKSFLNIGKKADYEKMLVRGFEEYPGNEYFFATLIKDCNDKGDNESAMHYATTMVNLYPDNSKYWYVKGKQEQYSNMLDFAITSYSHAISLKIDYAEPYASIGDIYIEMAHEVDETFSDIASDSAYYERKNNLMSLYQNAEKFYENAKIYAPETPALWLEGLEEVYFRLNKGDDLKRIEEYKKSMK